MPGSVAADALLDDDRSSAGWPGETDAADCCEPGARHTASTAASLATAWERGEGNESCGDDW